MFNYSVSIYLSAVGKQRKSFNNNQSFMPRGERGGGLWNYRARPGGKIWLNGETWPENKTKETIEKRSMEDIQRDGNYYYSNQYLVQNAHTAINHILIKICISD